MQAPILKFSQEWKNPPLSYRSRGVEGKSQVQITRETNRFLDPIEISTARGSATVASPSESRFQSEATQGEVSRKSVSHREVPEAASVTSESGFQREDSGKWPDHHKFQRAQDEAPVVVGVHPESKFQSKESVKGPNIHEFHGVPVQRERGVARAHVAKQLILVGASTRSIHERNRTQPVRSSMNETPPEHTETRGRSPQLRKRKFGRG